MIPWCRLMLWGIASACSTSSGSIFTGKIIEARGLSTPAAQPGNPRPVHWSVLCCTFHSATLVYPAWALHGHARFHIKCISAEGNPFGSNKASFQFQPCLSLRGYRLTTMVTASPQLILSVAHNKESPALIIKKTLGCASFWELRWAPGPTLSHCFMVCTNSYINKLALMRNPSDWK